MVSSSLLLHLVSAFAVGGAWVSFATLMAEKSGSAVGGFVGGLPSTSVFALLFIALNQSPSTAAQATTVYPLVFSFTCFFLLIYSFLAHRGFIVAIAVSLLIWFALSSLAVVSNVQFGESVAGCVLVGSAVYYLFATRLKLEDYHLVKIAHPTVVQLLGRAVLSGTVVSLAVLLSQVGGPVFGGVFSAFPAVFTSTLYLTDRSGGASFSRAIAPHLMVTSILTTVPYAIALRFLYPSLGIGLGTVLSYLSALPGACIAYTLSSRVRGGRREPPGANRKERVPTSETPESPAAAICRHTSVGSTHLGKSYDCHSACATCGRPVYFRYTIG